MTGVAFSPDGTRLASAGGAWGTTRPGEVKVWDAATGRELADLRGHTGPVMGVAFSPDGTRLASCCAAWDSPRRGEVKVWDAATGQEVLTLPSLQTGAVLGLTFSPDGRHLATAGADTRVRLWDLATGKELRTFDGATQNVFSVVFSRDGRRRAAGGRDGIARIWEVATGEVLALSEPVDVRAVAFSPDGLRLATASYGGTVKVWNASHGRDPQTVIEDGPPALAVAFSLDGRRLATTDGHGTVRVWDSQTLKEVRNVRGHTGSVICCVFSADGRRLATAGSDRTVKVWDLTAEREPRSTGILGGLVLAVVPASDGRGYRAVAGLTGDRGVQQVWAWTQGRRRQWLLPAPSGSVRGVALSPDGRRVATANADGTATVWDVSAEHRVHTLAGHEGAVRAVAFSPDGRRLASAGQDRVVKVWDAEGGELHTLRGHAGQVNAVAIDPTGRRLASAGADRVVKVWDLDSGRELADLPFPAEEVTAVAFDAAGRYLAAAGRDGAVHVWDLAGGGAEAATSLLAERGHPAPVTTLSFSPDGCRLASGGADGAIKLWALPAGREVLTLRGHPDRNIRAIAFSPEGRRLVSGGGEIIVWETADRTPEGRAARIRAATARAPAWHQREADQCLKARDWFGRAFHLSHLIELRPGEAGLHVHCGRAHAELEKWDEAAADYERAVELGETDWKTARPLALLYLRLGDENSYRKVCTRLLEAHGQTDDAGAANAIAETCVLIPEAVPDTAVVVRLAEAAVARQPKNAGYLNTLGVVRYRAGRYDDAVRRLEEAVQVRGQGGTPVDWLFLAMAQQRLGRPAEARRQLEKAVRWLDENAIPGKTPEETVPLSWSHRLELDLFRRQAEALLPSDPP